MKTWFPAFLIAVMLTLTQGVAGAEQAAKVPRIGYLSLDDPSSPVFESFRQGLRELGHIEGQSIVIESRFAYGSVWRLNDLAADLVRLRVDVIVAQGLLALTALRRTTETLPIVMAYFGDPVAAGIIKSLEHPGGNVTGIGGLAGGLGGKWLELLKQIVPSASQVGVLYSRFSEQASPMMKELEVAARSLHVELQPGEADRRGPLGGMLATSVRAAVGAGFDWATRGQADAIVVLPHFAVEENAGYVAGLALKRRIPSIFWRTDFAEAGGLVAYGANETEQFRRAAYVVDKILKGTKPTDLPVELPKTFELTINLKTAKEIGVTIPPRVLAWADKVIK